MVHSALMPSINLDSLKGLSGLSAALGIVASLGLVAACSSDSDDGNGGTGGSSSGGTPGAGGSQSKGGTPGNGGTPSNGGSGPSGGAQNNGGSSSGGSSSGGSSTTGGTQSNGGMAGAGAGGAGGNAGGAGAGGTPSGGQGGGAGAAGSGAGTAGAVGVACPAGATFCSGFEDTTLPTGAVYKANAAPGDWGRDFAVDTTLFRSGRSSLRVKGGDEAGISGMYRMVAVPTPGAAFWVRFYIQQTELDIGGMGHNVFAGAAGSDEPNDAVMVEFAEDVGVAFNSKDVVRWPAGFGRTATGGTMPFTLPKGMWHCIEISYDSATRVQKLFVNGTQQIDATDFPAASGVSVPFKNFKFGFNQLHGPARKVWYDDVAVAAARINCL